MARNIKLQNVKDFTGGLNLRADAFELAVNESPDLLNVDIDPRGGVEQRNGVTTPSMTINNPNLLTVNESTAMTAVAGTATNGTVTRDTVNTYTSTFGTVHPVISFGVTAAAQATYFSALRPVTTALAYSAFARLRRTNGAGITNVWLRIDWYTAASAFISSTTGGVGGLPAASAAYLTVTAAGTAPALATQAIVVVVIGDAGPTLPAAGDVDLITEVMLSRGENTSYWLDPAAIGLGAGIKKFGRFFKVSPATDHLFAATHGNLWYRLTGTENWFLLWATVAEDFAMVQMKDMLVIGNGYYNGVRTWNGTTLSASLASAPAFNDNLAAPVSAWAPKHKFSAVFQGSMWVGYTSEAVGTGAEFPNRVRWSHPNYPLDFRSFDFIDIDTGVDGDHIRALVPWGDKLLVFKKHSIHVISGTSPDTYQVQPVSRTLGAVDEQAIVATPVGVYFYDQDQGVNLFDGREIRWQFERIYPLIQGGHIPGARTVGIRLGWSGRRLWLSVPWKATRGETDPLFNTRTYVMDPTLSKQGSWTTYSLAIGGMYLLGSETNSNRLLGGAAHSSSSQGRYFVLEDPQAVDQPYDQLYSGNAHIDSHYVSPWFDAGQPVLKKKWARFEFVARSLNSESTLQVSTRIDWDSRITKRSFTITTSVDDSEMLWGDTWGEDWSGGDSNSPRSEHHRGPSLGQSRAIQLKIAGPPDNKHWGVDEMSIKFVVKPPRS